MSSGQDPNSASGAPPGMPPPLPGLPPGAYPPPGYAMAPNGPVAAHATDPSLRAFWEEQAREVDAVGTDPAQFKNHQLPLARIKKIMKSDEDVRMISAEAPVLFARACEMFILELTLRAWAHADENKRRTLQRNDVAAAITRTDIFDFLVDIVPREALAAPGDGGVPFWPAGVPPPSVEGMTGAQGVVDSAMLQYWQAQAASGGGEGWAPPQGGDGAPPPQ